MLGLGNHLRQRQLTKNDGNGFPTGIFHNLLKNRQFARRYYQRANEVLADDGPLGQQSVVEVWDSLYNTISTALYAEAARWGDYRRDVHRWQSKGKLYTVDDQYMTERKRLLREYFPYRTKNVLASINNFVRTTGISTAGSEMADHRYYNLQGQQVTQPRRGIYIVNGKKVIIK